MSSSFKKIAHKVLNDKSFLDTLQEWKKANLSLVFTNGCFDLIHVGHLKCLAAAKDLGDKLIVGLNSDNSIKRLKGNERPIKDERTRAYLLASLAFVDAVVIFEEDTPLNLITTIQPYALVKGGDWPIDSIVGADLVLNSGGIVKSLDFGEDSSTTDFVEKIKGL